MPTSKLSTLLSQYDSNYELKLIIKYIIADFQQPLSYLLAGLMIGAAIFVLSILINALLGREPISLRSLAWFLFAAYLVVLVQEVLLSRAAGSRSEINLTLFGTWGATAQSHAYVIENILLFLPFGFLLPMCIPKLRGISNVFCLAFFLSISIEIIQYFTGRGYSQLDDVVMNTLGAVIGHSIYYVGHVLYLLIHRD